MNTLETYVLVAAATFRRKLSTVLSTDGGVFSRSSGVIPPFSILMSAITPRAFSGDKVDMWQFRRELLEREFEQGVAFDANAPRIMNL